MSRNLFNKHSLCCDISSSIFSTDTRNLVEYSLFNSDFLKDCGLVLGNIYKSIAIIYGNQCDDKKEEYLKYLAGCLVELADYQEDRLDSLFKPNGKVIRIKKTLEDNALEYINSHESRSAQEIGRRTLREINGASNNELRYLLGSWSAFFPFVHGDAYDVCSMVSGQRTSNLDIDRDYALTMEATRNGENSSVSDVLDNLNDYVEGIEHNSSVYMTTNSVVREAIKQCIGGIYKVNREDRFVRVKKEA